MQRVITPEILDSLPEDHPDAVRNRRELHGINRLMGNYTWFLHSIKQHASAQDHLVEWGAGRGDLGSIIHNKGTEACRQLLYTGVDTCPRPATWPSSWHWLQQDLTQPLPSSPATILIGNLILHQFDAATIQSLTNSIHPRTRMLAFNEPLRSAFCLRAYRALAAVTLSHVSRHDGAVSIQAGFRLGELPALLGLNEQEWIISESSSTLRGAYRMLAHRRMSA